MVSVSDIVTVALVGGIGVGGYYLYKHRNDIGNAIGEIGGTISEAATDYQDSGLYQTGTDILEVTGKISDGSNPVTTFVEGSRITNPFEMAVNLIGNVGGEFVDAVGGFLDDILNPTTTTTPIVETPTPIVEDTTSIEDNVTPSQKYKSYAITRKLLNWNP